MTKILALDVGEKRIGLAMSDELGIIASPYKTISRDEALEAIEQITKIENVGRIVVGMPYLESGELGSQSKDVLRFTDELKKQTRVPIDFENEILSSNEAKKRYKDMGIKATNKASIDEMAATIILEDYLGRKVVE